MWATIVLGEPAGQEGAVADTMQFFQFQILLGGSRDCSLLGGAAKNEYSAANGQVPTM